MSSERNRGGALVGCLAALGILFVLCILAVVGLGFLGAFAPAPSVADVLDIGMRESMMLAGTGVLQIRNTTDRSIGGVYLRYHNTDKDARGSFTIGTFAPYDSREIGTLESGWAIEVNEQIIIGADGYEPVTVRTERGDDGKFKYWVTPGAE